MRVTPAPIGRTEQSAAVIREPYGVQARESEVGLGEPLCFLLGPIAEPERVREAGLSRACVPELNASPVANGMDENQTF